MSDAKPSVFDLSAAEKLQLVEDLWDDLASTPENLPIHEWHKEELARRNANLQRHPASVISWAEVKQRLRARNWPPGLFLRLRPNSTLAKPIFGMSRGARDLVKRF